MSVENRNHWPFIRAPLRLKHFIPVIGCEMWFREERRLMDEVPRDVEWPDKGKLAKLITIGVSTWPESRTPEETLEHMKTQLIHGLLVSYHTVGVTIGVIEMIRAASNLTNK